jgi:phosphosulfolactate synthase (CoM biosynthesis protein A)
LHNLSGVFIKEEPKTEIQGISLFCFSIVYGESCKNYYIDDEDEYKNWVLYIKYATGCSSLIDTYQIKVIYKIHKKKFFQFFF